jgi:release factor glutamine methyltransferase
VTTVTITRAIQNAQSQGLERLDAQLLALHALGRSSRERAWLLAHGDDAMPEGAWARLQSLAQRRADGEPLAYITGFKEFYGLNLAVDARVLDPRADTETLVDWALERMDAWQPTGPDAAAQARPAGATGAAAATPAPTPAADRLLHAAGYPPPGLMDLGTGSGAIALALKHSRAQWQVHALDFSTDALRVARDNAARLALEVQFHQGTWLTGLRYTFALIVSNPPYIAAQDAHLAALTHEPLQALASGADGLDDIRHIIEQAPAHLQASGWLLLEHGYDQAATVRALLQDAGFSQVQSRHDLAGIERCSGGQWTGSANAKTD